MNTTCYLRLIWLMSLVITGSWGMANPPSRVDSLKGLLAQRPTDSVQARIFNELGDIYAKSNPDSAFHFTSQVRRRSRASKQPAEIARSYRIDGLAFWRLGAYDSAIVRFESSRSIYQSIGDRKRVALLLNNLATVYDRKAKPETALELYLEALTIQLELNNLKAAGTLYLGIGNVHLDLKEFRTALTYFNRAYNLEPYRQDELKMYGLYTNMGNAYNYLGDKDSALYYYENALALMKKHKVRHHMPIILNNIAEVHRDQGRFKAAHKHYDEVIRIMEELKFKNGWTYIHESLGQSYQQQEKYDLAATHFQKALNHAKANQEKGLAVNILARLSSCYEKMKDFRLALTYHQQMATLKDSIFNTEKSKQITELQSRYDLLKEKIEKEELLKERRSMLFAIQHKELLILVFILAILTNAIGVFEGAFAFKKP